MFRLIAIVFLMSWCGQTFAQNAPQVCARLLVGLGQDSVTWQATPCGGFAGYVVLGQENNTGPFLPLDTVFTNNIVHLNPSENIWHYQVGMICNGALTNISQAVSNQRPVTPDILNVNIVNGVPVVNWNPSPSPEVIGYQIYKENPYGSNNFFPYPNPNSIVNGTSFTDNNATSLLSRYALVAVSACNKSLLGVGGLDGTTGPHTSILLEGKIDTCQQRIKLNWNHYENWRDGVAMYQIMMRQNGGPLLPIDTVLATDSVYVYSDAQDNDVLAFQVRAIEQNQNNYAHTNTLTFNVAVNRPMDYIYITEISVVNNNSIQIRWEWDTDVDFANGELLKGTDSSVLAPRLNLPVIGSAQNSFTDSEVTPEDLRYFYRVKTTDACGHNAFSNFGSTILLSAEALDEFQNKVTWNPAFIEYGEVQDYWLYKGPNRIAILPDTQSIYIDDLNVSNESEYFSCYSIVANYKLTFPNGMVVYSSSRSNEDCVTQGSDIHIPNAVSPNGENTKFRPVVVFGRNIQSYNMQIFDRYGAKIFESNDLYDAWDGTKDGQPLRQGVYVYVIQYIAPNGDRIERKGTVMLIR